MVAGAGMALALSACGEGRTRPPPNRAGTSRSKVTTARVPRSSDAGRQDPPRDQLSATPGATTIPDVAVTICNVTCANQAPARPGHERPGALGAEHLGVARGAWRTRRGRCGSSTTAGLVQLQLQPGPRGGRLQPPTPTPGRSGKPGPRQGRPLRLGRDRRKGRSGHVVASEVAAGLNGKAKADPVERLTAPMGTFAVQRGHRRRRSPTSTTTGRSSPRSSSRAGAGGPAGRWAGGPGRRCSGVSAHVNCGYRRGDERGQRPPGDDPDDDVDHYGQDRHPSRGVDGQTRARRASRHPRRRGRSPHRPARSPPKAGR